LTIILSGINTLEQHLDRLIHQPEDYRPPRCPSCGLAGLHRHGTYGRKADRSNCNEQRLNPIPIPRFLCPNCRASCSTLPACIPPRRWYLWAVQQLVLQLLLAGISLRECSRRAVPDRRTIGRWMGWLNARFTRYGAALRSIEPDLGRTSGMTEFWDSCLGLMSLSEAMDRLHRHGEVVP
jgi:transposase-like protein